MKQAAKKKKNGKLKNGQVTAIISKKISFKKNIEITEKYQKLFNFQFPVSKESRKFCRARKEYLKPLTDKFSRKNGFDNEIEDTDMYRTVCETYDLFKYIIVTMQEDPNAKKIIESITNAKDVTLNDSKAKQAQPNHPSQSSSPPSSLPSSPIQPNPASSPSSPIQPTSPPQPLSTFNSTSLPKPPPIPQQISPSSPKSSSPSDQSSQSSPEESKSITSKVIHFLASPIISVYNRFTGNNNKNEENKKEEEKVCKEKETEKVEENKNDEENKEDDDDVDFIFKINDVQKVDISLCVDEEGNPLKNDENYISYADNMGIIYNFDLMPPD